MNYRLSFYYWAGFISQGFASVQLDDALLDEIHARLEQLPRESSEFQGNRQEAMQRAMLKLTRETYQHMEETEQALSRECYEKWRAVND